MQHNEKTKPYISIVIPARNEEKNLPLCFEAIRIAGQKIKEEIEIIVVVNRCTDSTAEVARLAGCKVIDNEEKNLSLIRNTGIAAARGDIIICIDADSRMSENMLAKIVSCMKAGKHIGGGVSILPERWSPGIALSMLALVPFLIYWGVSAGLFFARAEDIRAIGGFNPNLFSAEDIDFARRLKQYGAKRGLKFKNLWSAWIITSCRKFDRFGDWYALKHPILMLKLLRGGKSAEADKLWYDF